MGAFIYIYILCSIYVCEHKYNYYCSSAIVYIRNTLALEFNMLLYFVAIIYYIINKGNLICATFLAAPSRVSGVTLTKTVESQAPALRVTWTTTQSDLTISQYQVEYRRSDTASWNNATALSVSPPVTSTILTGLDAGTEYTVRVRAVSAAGHGNWSVERTGRTFCREFNASSTLIDASTLVGQIFIS